MYSQMTQRKASKGFFIKNKKLGMTNFRFYMEKHYTVTHLNVFKISNVEGPASCSFDLNPSQRYTKNLGLGKCSSHFTSSELFYSWSNEHLLILLSSLGSAIHPSLLLAFIVSKWIAIPSRKKELTFLVSWMYLLFPVLCFSAAVTEKTRVSQNVCTQYRRGTALSEPDSFQLYSSIVFMPWYAFLILLGFFSDSCYITG